MESYLNKMFEDLEKSFHDEFSGLFYHVHVSQVINSFDVLIRKKRGELSGKKARTV